MNAEVPMSSMWDVDVVNRGDGWIDLHVTVAHPDAGPLAASRGFALQLLLRPAYALDERYQRVPACPLGEAVPFHRSYDAVSVATFADRFVRAVTVHRAIADTGAGRGRRGPEMWIRVAVTDPKWIAHLTPGDTFGAASWCPTGPYLTRDVHLGDARALFGTA